MMTIPMSSPDITQAEIDAVNHVLHTPHLSMGLRLDEFEQRMAEYIGARHAVAVSSGTAGLHLAVIAAGIGEGDRVITTPFSFVASANCILYERGAPVFVDVDPVTGNLDPVRVAEAVHRLLKERDKGRLKAILPVHVFGQPVDMDPIVALAHEHSLRVIEDACEAIGAEYKEHKAGTLGHAGVMAFYPNKQMTTGEGGIILTDDDEWSHLFGSLRNQGRDIFDAWLTHSRLGYNYRLDEMSTALGLAQLNRIEELLSKRERVANWYNERLADVELIERPCLAPTTTRMSWFVYVVRIKPPASRDQVMRRLAQADVPSRPYFTAIHLQPFYRARFGYQRGDFPITEYLSDISLALPFSGMMTEDQVDYVCRQLRASIADAGKES